MKNVPSLEAVYHDFKEQGVAFYYVYKSLAHPEHDGFVQPVTLEERLAHIQQAKKQLDTDIPWLADSMANDLKHAFGDKNNSEFIVSPDGKIAVARTWSNPEVLRADLENRVGKPKSVTKVSDLNLMTKLTAGGGKYPTHALPLVQRPQAAEALVTHSVPKNEEPFYLKLRAEAPPSVLRSGGKGTLYLGFRLDPIHQVHWNNLAAPLKFEIQAPEGVNLSPTAGVAAVPAGINADAGPREFLLDIELGDTHPQQPIIIKATYFACDDGEQWCKAMTAEFKVELKTDPDGGRVNRRGGKTRSGKASPDSSSVIFSRMDRNQDGKISIDEAAPPLKMRFPMADSDQDGFISAAELKAMMDRRRREMGEE